VREHTQRVQVNKQERREKRSVPGIKKPNVLGKSFGQQYIKIKITGMGRQENM